MQRQSRVLPQFGLIHGDFNEFNLLVEESQKVWTIDFPQIVSTSHPDANFYFDRDQECIHVIFKRKFQITSDRRYKLSDIELKVRLDAQVKASGYLANGKIDEDEKVLLEYINDRKNTPEGQGQQEDEDSGDGEGEEESMDEIEENESNEHQEGAEMKEIGQIDDDEIEREMQKIETGALDQAKPTKIDQLIVESPVQRQEDEP